MLGRGGRAALEPGGDRLQRIVVEWHGVAAARLAVAEGHPPRGRPLDGVAQARVVRGAALIDVADQQPGGLGAAQAYRPKEWARARERAPGASVPERSDGRSCLGIARLGRIAKARGLA